MDAGDVVKLEVTRLVTQEELHRLGRAVEHAGYFLLQESYVLEEGDAEEDAIDLVGDAAGHHGV